MNSSDKDFRIMAINDLSRLLKENINMDDDLEESLVCMLLRLTEDKIVEVQNLAVKCLGLVVNKIKDVQIEIIVESLCSNMMTDDEQLCDVSGMAIKTIIAELPEESGMLTNIICKRIARNLLTAIQGDNLHVKLKALSITAYILTRFGNVLWLYHMPLLSALLSQLHSLREAVRKRTIDALSILVLSCNNPLYIQLLNYLYDGLTINFPSSESRTCIQCLAAICRQSGQRIGKDIKRFLPVISRYIYEGDDDTKEFCLQTLEAFIQHCSNEITPHVPTIIKLCIKYITYDPNYNYDKDDDSKEVDIIEDDLCDDQNEYSDDDDMSWKIRRSAAKCLESVITIKHELLSKFYEILSTTLIGCFKEREETVKSDIFHTYIALLKQTKRPISIDIDPNSMKEDETLISSLQKQIPLIVKGVQGQMKEKSIKTRQDCFQLLKELCGVLPGALTHHIEELLSGILHSLNEQNFNSNLKIDSLSFIYCLLTSHPPEVFQPYMIELLEPVINLVVGGFYKITAEALLVLQELIKVMCALNSFTFDYNVYALKIYEHTLITLKASDIHHDVKEKAISTMGQIICNLGDRLTRELPVCLPIFLDRLQNNVTSSITVKTLIQIVASPFHVILSPIINDVVVVLGSLLRNSQRELKLNIVLLLDHLIKKYIKTVHVDLLCTITAELPTLLNDTDFQMTQCVLLFLSNLVYYCPFALQYSTTNVLLEVLNLLKSSFLQDCVLNSIMEFLQNLVESPLSGVGYNYLFEILLSPITHMPIIQNTLPKQAYYSLAKCVAAITIIHKNQALDVVNKFINYIQIVICDYQHIFSLLVIGEIGRKIDLTSIANLKEVMLNCFFSLSDEVKSAASYALGSVSIGNLQGYLPFILLQLENKPERRYLLLRSLKDVITYLCSSQDGIEQLFPFVPDIWQQLFFQCESIEADTRSTVAECLGKLTVLNPTNLLPLLQEYLYSDSPLMRMTALTAVKFVILDQPHAIEPLFQQCIGEFLNTIRDPDVNVRRIALAAFNFVAHNKPSLIQDWLDLILPHLYNETKVNKDLIQEITIGPFRSIVDDGLDIRKVAFECLYTILESSLKVINVFEFLNYVEGGLNDHYDIKMLTYLMVARLAQLCPEAVLQRLDRLIIPLWATCTMKPNINCVTQEHAKQNELQRCAMRAVYALVMIPNSDKSAQLNDLMIHIEYTPDLRSIFKSIQRNATATAPIS